jgi:hypothetical protein
MFMKQFSHAWLAFKAIERLEKVGLDAENRRYADQLIRWFWDHRDGVIKGAWYPDMIIKDMATSHVLKFIPSAQGETEFRSLPDTCQVPAIAVRSTVYGQPYKMVDASDNLPERCEALAHSVIDNLKMRDTEDKGSSISPTDNHIATCLFMLSHYVADAHMPLHCDGRSFSSLSDIHAEVESDWDKEVRKHFKLDLLNDRFYYNPEGYPLRTQSDYSQSFLKRVDDGLATRAFSINYGGTNNNVRTYMLAVCQYSYLLSYAFFPPEYNETNVDKNNWKSLPGQLLDFEQLSEVVFNDAIDAIARVWFRVWRRYVDWVNS